MGNYLARFTDTALQNRFLVKIDQHNLMPNPTKMYA
jgi:hypothetical protein